MLAFWAVTVVTKLFFYCGLFLAGAICVLGVAVPVGLRQSSQFRCSATGFFSAWGLEWRPKYRSHTVVPVLRIEKISLGWGLLGGQDVGLLVFRVEGLSFRVKRKGKDGAEEAPETRPGSPTLAPPSSVSSITSRVKTKLISQILHLLIHHYPSLARLVSVQLVDIRVIFDELDALEVTLARFRLGVKVHFEGKDESLDAYETPTTSPTPSSGEFKRTNPLTPVGSTPTTPTRIPINSPEWVTSPLLSPNFPILSTQSSPSRSPTVSRPSKLSLARLHASHYSSRMTTTAGQIWSRAIARAWGSVSLCATLGEFAVILPATLPPVPNSASLAEFSNSFSQKSSTRYGHSQPQDNLQNAGGLLTPAPSSDNFLRPTAPRRSTSVIKARGYEKLIALDGTSKVTFNLGFGPKKGLLGEDTLRTSVELGRLQMSLDAGEKLQELLKTGFPKDPKMAGAVKEDQWSPEAMPRIILRAFEAVSVSFDHVALLHHLPHSSSQSPSARSSSTDLSGLASSTPDCFTISLDLHDISCRLSAADSSNNDRARNAFGTNPNPASKVRGIGFALKWSSVAVHCIGPRETSNDRSQLLAVHEADVEGLSTWRPAEWSREELLFANDPNLALVVFRGAIASLNVAADLQLLNELKDAWKHNRPVPVESVVPVHQSRITRSALPPRVRMVVDVGHAMVLLADRDSEQQTTFTVSSDGLHLGCFTGFSELSGRRRDKNLTRAAFKLEEALIARREEAGHAKTINYAQPESMLKPQLRRQNTALPASLQDDLSLAMRADMTLALEPISVCMTLSGRHSRNTRTYDLASFGRMHGTITGDVLGRVDVADNGDETAALDHSSLSCSVDLGIDHGIKVDLWEMPVIQALVAIGEAHRQSPIPLLVSQASPRTLLDRLPCGVSGRISFGLISIYVGHDDPNPLCKLQLNRGLWMQTQATFEYAFYRHKSQTLAWRHALTAPARAKLKLPEDITTQALANFRTLYQKGGQAALFSINIVDLFVKPIFNGERFEANGGTSQSRAKPEVPKEREDDHYVGWEFRRPPPPHDLDHGQFANNVPPFQFSDAAQARRPFVQVPETSVNLIIRREETHRPAEHRLTGKIAHISCTSDLSHVYCVLLAVLTLKNLAAAFKRAKLESEQKLALNLSIDVAFPIIWVHLALPLKEQIFLYMGGFTLSKPCRQGIRVASEHVTMYVPSARETGSWEELVRIKRIAATAAPPGEVLTFNVSADALRVRIPVGYYLSKLVLNTNVAIKSIKLLAKDLGGAGFASARWPAPELPKKIIPIKMDIKYMSLEAKDHPIETKLNLIWRAGLHEQETRNHLDEGFERKIHSMHEPHGASDGPGPLDDGSHASRITGKRSVSTNEARLRLDWHKSQSWIRRIKAAKLEQERREKTALEPMSSVGPNGRLPITVTASTHTAPLFRAAFRGVRIGLSDPGMSRKEIIDYMGDVSAPFKEDVDFSLMVPLKLSWAMDEATCTLRDYPLPLIRVQPVKDGSAPAWHLETTLIIAEEIAGNDSVCFIPCEILPSGLGAPDAADFHVQIAKTIMPVKTYARPVIKIASERTTDFTWGSSYQPAIQDMMKVVETLSQAPRDPSPKVGFWDKLRLILHWRVTIEFRGPVHLHLKGSFDPYAVTGRGAGFALSWRHGTRFDIGQPNAQHETIQISAQELLIAIPDLTALFDGAAIGNQPLSPSVSKAEKETPEDELIERRYTKPCARFLNGVRVGFGFAFERTCRPWTCSKCGSTEKLLHRQCRIFDFKQHQDVILRSAEAVRKDEERLGHQADSYESFRSDYIHFSVSVVAPLNPTDPKDGLDADKQNSLHFTPKAFAHFFAWWNLFDHTMSLPIRQGKLFPLSPPPSKKFGRSLATIKYRFDLAPVFISHTYSQVSQELWAAGKAQALGVKMRFGRFRADAHQRAQEKIVRHEKLRRKNVVVHKPFYAADLLLDDIHLKGVRAEFNETQNPEYEDNTDVKQFPTVSKMTEPDRSWFNFFDFIDADRLPLDRNPRIELVDIGDCPQIFFSRRKKARQTTPQDDDGRSMSSGSDASGLEMESSKFGHEKSHICYLGAAEGVGPTQLRLTRERIHELETKLHQMDSTAPDYQRYAGVVQGRLKTLKMHLADLSNKERRHIDDDTLQSPDTSLGIGGGLNPHGEQDFEHTFHIHCPRIYFNNASRNIVYKYYFSSRDRKREEYTTSWASLRGIPDQKNHRQRRQQPGSDEDDSPGSNGSSRTPTDIADDMLKFLEKALQEKRPNARFRLPDDHAIEHDDFSEPRLGLPEDTILRPRNRFLVLKPQIALRSEADENAIILLAVEEIHFKGFEVLDQAALDPIAEDVLDRSYVSMKGLQAFYPSEEALHRRRGTAGVPKGLDFVPLEIFLDVRSEATDYDRIVLKTDAAISLDKFNHLRTPRGLNWPHVVNAWGEEISHLRLHQDLTTVIVPRLTVSATSKHYTALYNVVTDLLVYQDPHHRQRNERVDNFFFAFDRKDRDPARLKADLAHLQKSIRDLAILQRGYERNVPYLTTEGKAELFKIRTDALDALEQLFTVFEVINVNKAREAATNALKTATRTEVRIGGMAWHMLLDDFTPLIKLDIEGMLYSQSSNKDGSTDSALAFGDLSALNSNADVIYPEVLVRYEGSSSKSKKQRETFASACWSFLAPVGGISIVRQFIFRIHPVRFKLEETVGHEIVDYIFNDRVKRRREKNADKHGKKGEKPNGFGSKENGLEHTVNGGQKTHSGMATPNLYRSTSQMSIASTASTSRFKRHVSGHDPQVAGDGAQQDTTFTMVPMRDATEMRKRASVNKTFIRVVFASTSIVLSYKSDERKKHKTFSIPDCVDFKVKTPEMSYNNKVWSHEDVFEHVKRDIRSYAWSQTGDLLSQVIKKTSIFRSKKTLKHIAPFPDVITSAWGPPPLSQPSKLRYTVEAATPVDHDAQNGVDLARALSRGNRDVQPVARIMGSRSSSGSAEGPHILGLPLNDDPFETTLAMPDEVEAEEGGKVGRAVKGLFGRLKPRHSGARLEGAWNRSTDELARVISGERSRQPHSAAPVAESPSGWHGQQHERT